MASWLGSCFLSEHAKVQRSRSRKIDRMLARDKKNSRLVVKLLLLGAGESGKSTFLKQMRIIHGSDFNEDSLREYKPVIYMNILKGMKVLIDARNKLKVPWEDPQKQQYANRIFSIESTQDLDETDFLPYVDCIEQLWDDKAIKLTFDRRREFQLGDSLRYFLENILRIGKKSYIPSKLDILLARKATKGIVEHPIKISGVPFLFVDVGGQRSQRPKWYKCFDDVTSILFLVSSSEYDQVLQEDRKTNRLVESCDIFETLVNYPLFAGMAFILFLNKTDLLEEKVKQINIKDYFSNYSKDPHSITDVQSFILDMFDNKRRNKSGLLYHHFTTAIDTENIRFVFDSVKSKILQDNLRTLMLQ
ncbi:guanine nucleotide-binding protein subunit alpha-13-like isoform X2 [Argonauta hians]